MRDVPMWNRTLLTLLTSVVALVVFSAMDPLSNCESCSQRPSAPPVAVVDTLAESVQAGEALIVVLPETVGERPAEEYRIHQAPALASVAGRSLLWVTRAGDTGSHQIILSARMQGGDVDTLWVNVDVQ